MNETPMVHQYIERGARAVKTEKLFADRLVNLIYSDAREKSPGLFKALTSARMSSLAGFVNYDLFLKNRIKNKARMIQELNIDLSECLEPENLTDARSVFERKIKFWKTRPMPENSSSVVSPSDARILVGSLEEHPMLFVKEKFFEYEELLGRENTEWIEAFESGSVAILRLTPDKYHYNHAPVSGIVRDIYEIDGEYHSCNPAAVLTIAAPYSRNKRVVTIVDTDVEKGTLVGLVAMIEVAALMIGDIRQCYSDTGYDCPRQVRPGMFLKKGAPKSLFKPGSSTVVLLFAKNKVAFSPDLVENLNRRDVLSRFSAGLGRPLVETDAAARSEIATRRYVR